jgi:hypothetical protein
MFGQPDCDDDRRILVAMFQPRSNIALFGYILCEQLSSIEKTTAI